MFSKFETFYLHYNVYKTIIITANDDNEYNTIKSFLINNDYSPMCLTHIEDYHSNDNIDNIININKFKNDDNRILLITYSTWYNNKHLLKHLLLDNNLVVIGNIYYENSRFIYNWIYNFNKKTFFYNLFDEVY